jgi:predicted TIM-barrel fold metal-dependent hydrolase
MTTERYSKQPQLPSTSPRHLPRGSCDCHGHIFPAPEQYPTANEAMPLAPIELYVGVHRHLGFERGVLVQGGAYRHDNRAMFDALSEFPHTLRGVALIGGDAPDATLAGLRDKGVRALRFTRGGASRIADLRKLGPRMKQFGLHAELFIGTDEFAALETELLSFDVPLVLDHLAGPFDAAHGPKQPGFQRVVRALASGRVWVKLCPQRNSRHFPSYDDVRPFYDLLLETRPDRLVWGSDWPFPNMSDQTPDAEVLLDLFLSWVGDKALQRQILADNPARLYGFMHESD